MKNFRKTVCRGCAALLNKRLLMFLLVVGCAMACMFADDDEFGLNEKVGILVDLLESPWVKGIACIALVVECIGMITAGRQEPGMFKKFIPWIAGTIIFMAAGKITTKFMKGQGTAMSDVMKASQVLPSQMEEQKVPLAVSAIYG